MNKKYRIINEFECCGKHMVTVIIKGKAACVISELEYNKIIGMERKKEKMNFK